MNNNLFDIVVIGGGVIGAFLSRELAKYNLKVCVLEANNDVGDGASGANSAIIHSGYDPKPGTLKAKFNTLANPMWDEIANDLDIHFYRTGSLTVAFNQDQVNQLKELENRSKINNVEVKLLNKEETLKMEPNLSKEVMASLFAPSAGVIDSFITVVAAFENAVDNGVKLFLNNKVMNINKEDNLYKITTSKDIYYSEIVINAAGTHADDIAKMIEDIDWNITSRRGEYFVLDHYAYGLVRHTIFPLPSEKGKGVLVTYTSSGNYLLGPSSEFVLEKDDVSTDKLTLDNVKEQVLNMIPSIPMNQTIKVFSGNRPTCSRHDFIIEYSNIDKHFINVSGIESPGFVSAPAIAKYVVDELVAPIKTLTKNISHNPKVRKHPIMFDLSIKDRANYVKDHPEFGEIICNCEKISKGEILDALSRSVPPYSIKGIRKRVRAGFGKCQGGFCQPKVLMLLADYYHISPLDVVFSNENSNIILSEIKEDN